MEYTTYFPACQSLYRLLDQCQPQEIVAVLAELRSGRLSGQWEGDCVIGIIARGRGQCYRSVGLACEVTQPMEDWLLDIIWGQTPASSEKAQLLESWLLTWLDLRTIELSASITTEVSA